MSKRKNRIAKRHQLAKELQENPDYYKNAPSYSSKQKKSRRKS
ncbi:hypothetical protein [Lactococcus lactis]|nr:hypothetical protein [Lactococcus lactis]MDT2898502.1 hypothetical protein [Lactococcus lactis]